MRIALPATFRVGLQVTVCRSMMQQLDTCVDVDPLKCHLQWHIDAQPLMPACCVCSGLARWRGPFAHPRTSLQLVVTKAWAAQVRLQVAVVVEASSVVRSSALQCWPHSLDCCTAREQMLPAPPLTASAQIGRLASSPKPACVGAFETNCAPAPPLRVTA